MALSGTALPAHMAALEVTPCTNISFGLPVNDVLHTCMGPLGPANVCSASPAFLNSFFVWRACILTTLHEVRKNVAMERSAMRWVVVAMTSDLSVSRPTQRLSTTRAVLWW